MSDKTINISEIDFTKLLPKEAQEYYMSECIRHAAQNPDKQEVPIACLVVYRGQIICKTTNKVESLKNATAHAEILAIQKALEVIDEKYLEDAHIFVSLEPCPMCAGALSRSRAKFVYFAAFDPKAGFLGSVQNLATDQSLNHNFQVVGGMQEKESATLLQDFFKAKR